jgi:hypothetical protein
MLVYLFRQRRTDDLALTTDVTGRNIPAVTSSTDWLFVEALDTNKFASPWHIADVQGVLRRLRGFGYCIFGADC